MPPVTTCQDTATEKGCGHAAYRHGKKTDANPRKNKPARPAGCDVPGCGCGRILIPLPS